MDMCAAPGGKTSLLAASTQGAVVVAIDRSQRKVDQIRRTCHQMSVGDSVRTLVADSTRLGDNQHPYLKEPFDKVLLDAPCSALGQRQALFLGGLKEIVFPPRILRYQHYIYHY